MTRIGVNEDRMGTNLTFAHLRSAIFIVVATTLGCAVQPAAPTHDTFVDGASRPSEAVLRTMPPQFLRRALNDGFEPKLLFCEFSGSWVCLNHRRAGYRPMVLFCRSAVWPTGCFDEAGVKLILQGKYHPGAYGQIFPPDMTFGGP
jgi:hypothetical protein